MRIFSIAACGRPSRARSSRHGAADAPADGARLLLGVDVLGQADEVAERMADPGHRRVAAHEDASDQQLELAALHARAPQQPRQAQPARDHRGGQRRRAQPREAAQVLREQHAQHGAQHHALAVGHGAVAGGIGQRQQPVEQREPQRARVEDREVPGQDALRRRARLRRDVVLGLPRERAQALGVLGHAHEGEPQAHGRVGVVGGAQLAQIRRRGQHVAGEHRQRLRARAVVLDGRAQVVRHRAVGVDQLGPELERAVRARRAGDGDRPEAGGGAQALDQVRRDRPSLHADPDALVGGDGVQVAALLRQLARPAVAPAEDRHRDGCRGGLAHRNSLASGRAAR